MLNPIQLSRTPSCYEQDFKEATSLNIENANMTQPNLPEDYMIYTEAVFANGKKTIEPLIEQMQKCKDLLTEELTKQEKGDNGKKYTFDPKWYWRQKCWKDLEDILMKTFGFRMIEISPRQEHYSTNTKNFESAELNCMVWNSNRYPIEALVTDKGFYDKSKSCNLYIEITLGLINALEADEIIAVLLHEFGHGIDPAIVDISYIETNVLSKYMTDRADEINPGEKKVLDKTHKTFKGFLGSLTSMCKKTAKKFLSLPVIALLVTYLLAILSIVIPGLRESSLKVQEKKLQKALEEDSIEFNRQTYSEAFADNFARMYGMAVPLMRGLQKISKKYDDWATSWAKREKTRQVLVIQTTVSMLKDEHKTDIHRIRALIKEYDNDINDSNLPKGVKEAMKTDRDELEKVLDMYLNNFSEAQNNINKIILEELKKFDKDIETKAESSEDKESKNTDDKSNDKDSKSDTKDSPNKDNQTKDK